MAKQEVTVRVLIILSKYLVNTIRLILFVPYLYTYIFHTNMTSFKRFEYTPVVKYEYIGWAVLIVLPRHMIVYGWSTRRHRMIT